MQGLESVFKSSEGDRREESEQAVNWEGAAMTLLARTFSAMILYTFVSSTKSAGKVLSGQERCFLSSGAYKV